jgi:hypothetical protein
VLVGVMGHQLLILSVAVIVEDASTAIQSLTAVFR